MTKFNELGLAAPILKALTAEGYDTPTPIQAKAIPAVLTGADLLGIAQTGTGKTAAFALPILHQLNEDPGRAPQGGCRVLVLSPTRELASQIADSFKVYGRHMNLSISTIFGGVAPRPQIKALARGIDILIATPGRLLDHMQSGHANLGSTEILVLDEADQMLDLGFVKPIRTVVAALPRDHQTLFFSATMPREIAKLAKEFLEDPIKVTVTPVSSTVERIAQRIIFVETSKKRALLGELLEQSELSRTLIFTRTKRGADKVAKFLDGRNVGVAAIHGNKSQRQREQALNGFRNDRIKVLVATDIAARGIDVDSVSHVINYDLPEVPEAYVHRIGRTARAGASGSAISLCDGGERHLLRAIERLTKQSIPSEDRRKDGELEVEKSEPRQRGATGGRGTTSGRGGFGGRGRSDGRGAGAGGRGRSEGRGRSDERGAGAGGSRQDRGGRGARDERQGTGQRKEAGFDPMASRAAQLHGEAATDSKAGAGGQENNRRSRRSDGQEHHRGQGQRDGAKRRGAAGNAGNGRGDGAQRRIYERDGAETSERGSAAGAGRGASSPAGSRNKRTGSKARNKAAGDQRQEGGYKPRTRSDAGAGNANGANASGKSRGSRTGGSGHSGGGNGHSGSGNGNSGGNGRSNSGGGRSGGASTGSNAGKPNQNKARRSKNNNRSGRRLETA